MQRRGGELIGRGQRAYLYAVDWVLRPEYRNAPVRLGQLVMVGLPKKGKSDNASSELNSALSNKGLLESVLPAAGTGSHNNGRTFK